VSRSWPRPWGSRLARGERIVLTLLGTGLRFGELAGLRRRRVHLDRIPPVLQVVDICYQAGRFGSGFKPRPKSDAGIRELPLAPEVVAAIGRQLPPGTNPEDLVFTGPGGAVVARGTRTVLSRHNFHRTYRWSPLTPSGDPLLDAVDLRGAQHLGSVMGAHYRHTTPEGDPILTDDGHCAVAKARIETTGADCV
jgi:integrase